MPTINDLAIISKDVYEHSSSLQGRIHRIDQSGTLTDRGFFWAIYRCADSKVLAYAGSNDAQDWLANAQTYSVTNPQFRKVQETLKPALARNGVAPGHLAITGHSLGGGLAKFAALMLARSNTPAAVTVAFNAPNLREGPLVDAATNALITTALGPVLGGLGPVIADRLERDDMPTRSGEAGRLLNLRLDGDPVSRIGIPMGHTVTLPTPPRAQPTRSGPGIGAILNPGGYLARRAVETLGDRANDVLHAHSMDSMIIALADHPAIGNADARRYVARLGPAPAWD